jgi:hypothetical protein
MDIDGQTDDDDRHVHRSMQHSDEQDQHSPSSSAFVSHQAAQMISHRRCPSDHSNSVSDTNESHAESDLSFGDEDDDDLPSFLTDDDLRSKLIFIYNRFTSNSTHDLRIFVTFFKRNHLIDTSSLSMSKSSDSMFTYDLFSLSPMLIGELATDLGYTTNTAINQTEQ